MLDLEPNASAITNPELDERIASLNKNLDSLRMQFTELHPDIIASKRLIAQLEERKIEDSKLKTASGDPGKNYEPHAAAAEGGADGRGRQGGRHPRPRAGIQRAQ